MKIDGINLINDSSVNDARIENGDTLPTTNTQDEGRMYWLKRSYQDYVAGLYVSDGVKWNYTNDNDNVAANFNHSVVNMDAPMKSNTVVLADSSIGSFQLTLPQSPNMGDFIYIIDTEGEFKKNPVTVVRNGDPIRGKSENLKVKIKNVTLMMFYSGSSQGWCYSTIK